MKIKEQQVLIDKNGLPKPLEVNCFKCKNNFLVKFVIPKQSYSRKNNWSYWTEKEKHQNKYICNNCLRNTYYDKMAYWEAVKNPKKRALFRSYIYDKHI